MPHIRSVRLVNVHFNSATQFYDDFYMEFNGSNATYDLENGGGKSLLFLMMLQTVLPKSYMRREKPVSLIFQGGKDRTSHAVVEWILDEGSNYRYMMTGFTARKRKNRSEVLGVDGEEANIGAGDIEHISWYVFYNHGLNCKAVPLVKERAGGGKEYARFEDIRNFIQQLKQKGIPAESFDGIEKYQRELAVHNLISAEWNIIKDINSGENNIETYFRQHNTSRKLIEQLFVRIIEDMEVSKRKDKRENESLNLADTLIEIRSRLREYQQLKGHMAEFEKIREYYQDFGKRNDELLVAYGEVDGLKRQAAGIRNAIDERVKSLSTLVLEITNQMKAYGFKVKEKEIRKKLLEAGRITLGKNRLDLEHRQLGVEKEDLVSRLQVVEQLWREAKVLESYEGYRKVSARIKEALEGLNTLKVNENELERNYRLSGGRYRFLLEERANELQCSLEAMWENESELKEKGRINNEALFVAGKKETQLETRFEELVTKEEKLDEELEALKDYFFARSKSEAVMNPEEFLACLKTQVQSYGEEKSGFTERWEQIETELGTLGGKKQELINELALVQERKAHEEKLLRVYQEEKKELLGMAADFGKDNINELQKELEVLLNKESVDKLKKEIELGRVRQKQAISGERGYYVPNQELILLDEALSPSCEFVQPGVDWIDKLSLTEKKRVVDAMPFLPYAVIVDQVAFEKIRSGKHKFRFHSDFTVPIVNLEAVREVRNLSREDIVFTCDCAELIIDEQRFSLYLASIDNNIKEAEKEIESALERVGEINKKHVRVATFCENYPTCKVTEANDWVHNYIQRITDIESEQETCKQKEDMFITEKAAIEERIEKLVAAIIDGEGEALKLQSFIDKSGQFNELTIQINANKREHRGIGKKLVQLREREQELASSLRVLWDRIGEKKGDMREVKKEMVPLLSFDRIENELLLEDVRAAYIAGRDAVEGKSVAENSLREKITIGRQDLESLRDRVLREYDGDLEDVKQREGSGAEIFIPSRNEIIHLTQEKAGLGEQVTAKGKEITAVYGKIERAKGTLENIFGGVPEEYHQDIPDYEDERQYTREIRDTEQLIQNLRDKEGKLNIEADRLKNEQSTASHQLEGCERFLEREEIELDHTVKSEIREFRSFERGYLEQKNRLGELQGKWSDKLRVIERETIEFVIREPLDELSKMGMPVGVAQCGRKKEAFVEYILNLEEQMKKISEDIEKLEGYQKDFARRCIQRADLVLGDLRKLEALSRIEYDGRRVEMIRVRLNEFDDTEKQLRMKSHIDQIVREIGEEGTIDRHQVATRLATRELLAQIVDMDRARVMLFKVEGISEHSKHYRWEQALGSEGQNNSLYFIFAACLISYIRMLSITNTSANTKKVIVADNPFGSTSAVYLWDPMFKVLKQNNIQLIAPGHGIRRETTSRFSVNYLLNQDILQDGRRRVVVKDVRVEEDEDYMKYVDSEQMALFEE